MHLAAALALSAVLATPVHVSGALTVYDIAQAPVGSEATVLSWETPGGGTFVLLHTEGLLPDHAYGAHAHTKPCGLGPADSGPHFQHRQGGATDPAFANPDNEIWLDFTTNAKGSGLAVARVDWTFTDRRPASVVVHAEHTHTGSGTAGTAGARLACLSVPF
ncbi:superoxide dismutase [Umezawaea tangerina]|uniref:Cu-Zn family superoxide dismutase n=1 Tax=Umezawaea tangerina TaxID=84725 RepID=A0A2T0TC94_9PSEU|nr:superoxide dismutase [Umezawaea tangerina]PRY43287.1 Cu-Zn family superoxide dismutase [Umezawaea tangerina]